MTRSGWLLSAALVASCQAPAPLVRFQPGVVLRLVAAPGVRINARLRPALELADGTVLRFATPSVTADSAYFAAPPVVLPPEGAARTGTLRVSVCPRGERVCLTVTTAVTW